MPNFHWKRGYPFYRNIGGKQGLERGMGKELFQADPHRQGLHHPRSFHEHEPGYAYNIIIDPKMAFGTGNHETTFLMISEILKLDLTSKELLDMGCGTAVLAILAHMKGAGRVVAIDIDEWAYNNALENIRLNNTNDIQVALGEPNRSLHSEPSTSCLRISTGISC